MLLTPLSLAEGCCSLGQSDESVQATHCHDHDSNVHCCHDHDDSEHHFLSDCQCDHFSSPTLLPLLSAILGSSPLIEKHRFYVSNLYLQYPNSIYRPPIS